MVTGAARGIGAAVARRLAREGCAIVAIDIDAKTCATTVESINACGNIAIAICADVSNRREIAHALRIAANELGPPCILVNNAGFSRPARISEMTDQQWDDVIAVHLSATFHVSLATVPYMVDASWGRIVNISSIAALGTLGSVNYCTAKAGVIGLTKQLAMELGPGGITVNSIAPGFIVSRVTEAAAVRLGRSFAEHKRIEAAKIPVGRVGHPEDIAHAVAFFASEQAGFVSGQVLYVAGGPHG